jgi:hypothetical protein
MVGTPYSRPEFKFCYKALKELWNARTDIERAIFKKNLIKMRTLYHNLNDEQGVAANRIS